jgi:hypothetical protein
MAPRPAIAMLTQRAETKGTLGLGSWAARAEGIARKLYLHLDLYLSLRRRKRLREEGYARPWKRRAG